MQRLKMSANNIERSRPPRASRYQTNNTGAKSYTTAPRQRIRTESVESVPSTVPSFRSFIHAPPPSYSCNRCSQRGHWYKNCPLHVTRATAVPSGRPFHQNQQRPRSRAVSIAESQASGITSSRYSRPLSTSNGNNSSNVFSHSNYYERHRNRSGNRSYSYSRNNTLTHDNTASSNGGGSRCGRGYYVGESRKDGLGPLEKFPEAIRPLVPEQKAELAEYEIDESMKIPLNSISKACLETVHAIVKTDLYHDDNKQYNSSNLEILKWKAHADDKIRKFAEINEYEEEVRSSFANKVRFPAHWRSLVHLYGEQHIQEYVVWKQWSDASLTEYRIRDVLYYGMRDDDIKKHQNAHVVYAKSRI